jgi:hypothetical protein
MCSARWQLSPRRVEPTSIQHIFHSPAILCSTFCRIRARPTAVIWRRILPSPLQCSLPAQIWSGPDRGIQLFGVGHQADGTHAKRAAESYGERFRLFPKWKSKLTPDDPAREYQWYEFVPNYIKIFDEEAFGEAVFVYVDVERYRG